jgi:RNA polymerase sigma-70 factor (ECF subfamily)
MDEDLRAIERIQLGDEAGLSDLMHRHKEAVFCFSIRYTGNEADAAEITEETFYRVYLNAAKFKPKAKVRTWMFSITANLCRDFLRRRKKTSLLSSMESGDEWLKNSIDEPGLNPEEEAISKEAVVEIESAIHELPHKLKFPFIFCVLEDHTYDECAEVLNASRKTVETRIYRARHFLREKLVSLHANTRGG